VLSVGTEGVKAGATVVARAVTARISKTARATVRKRFSGPLEGTSVAQRA
jgi:hypothetical protein